MKERGKLKTTCKIVSLFKIQALWASDPLYLFISIITEEVEHREAMGMKVQGGEGWIERITLWLLIEAGRDACRFQMGWCAWQYWSGLDQVGQAGLAGSTPFSNLGVGDVEMGRLGRLSFMRLVP